MRLGIFLTNIQKLRIYSFGGLSEMHAIRVQYIFIDICTPHVLR